MSTAVAALWRENVKLRKRLDQVHHEHKEDIKSLTSGAIALGQAVHAKLLGGSTPSPQPLPTPPRSEDESRDT